MSELKDYKPETVRKYWTNKARKALVGKTITNVYYVSDKEAHDSMWYKKPVAIQLDNKYWLVPISDDEGNDGGAIRNNTCNII